MPHFERAEQCSPGRFEMNSASASIRNSPPSLMSRGTPIVFVVDDDISVRESLESLIRFAGWQPPTFASAQEFLSPPRERLLLPARAANRSGEHTSGLHS